MVGSMISRYAEQTSAVGCCVCSAGWPPFGVAGQPSFTDIGKVVDAFKSIPFVPGNPPDGAPRKVRAMVRTNSPPFDSAINFTDIGKIVDAFKTIAYAEVGPTDCP